MAKPAEKNTAKHHKKSGEDKKIYVFKNADKEGWYESWHEGRNWLNFPHPFRCIVAANPGSGKTNMIKNIIVRSKPHFNRIFLCHFDPDTKEYDDLEHIKLDELPDARSKIFSPKHKTLCIIDDYDFASLNKFQMNNLRSLFKYASTHRGVSFMVACQDFFNLPAIIRRLSNVYFLWSGSKDIDQLMTIGRRIGYTKTEFKEIIDMCQNKFDNICIDFTVDSPCKVRFNAYTPVKSAIDSLKAELAKQAEQEKTNRTIKKENQFYEKKHKRELGYDSN